MASKKIGCHHIVAVLNGDWIFQLPSDTPHHQMATEIFYCQIFLITTKRGDWKILDRYNMVSKFFWSLQSWWPNILVATRFRDWKKLVIIPCGDQKKKFNFFGYQERGECHMFFESLWRELSKKMPQANLLWQLKFLGCHDHHSDGDRILSVTIQHTSTIGWQPKFSIAQEGIVGIFLFSKIILHVSPPLLAIENF